VPVAFDVAEGAAFYLAEHDEEFPGVSVDVGPVREYPDKSLAAHLLGYTGEISADELKASFFDGYKQGTLVGKSGVERIYEKSLQGKEGLINYEVNAQGKVLRPLGEQPPVKGDDLVLSIDANVQRVAENSLKLGIDLAHGTVGEDGHYLNAGGGAVVVMDPRNGQVLAMSSYPTFNPSKFIGGITSRDYKALTAESRNFPLFDRAIQASYPPGSTFKPFVAAAAVKQRLTNLQDSTPCPAEFSYTTPAGLPDPSRVVFHNWKAVNSGYISLAQALIDSCDTVFYEFGTRFNHIRQRAEGTEFFQQRLREFGFDRPTGIDLPSETHGRIPDIKWLLAEAKTNPFFEGREGWLPGDDINMSIGQGNVLTSPIQLATAYSAIANGGTLYRPRIGLRLQRPDGEIVSQIKPSVAGRLPYSPTVLEYIRGALKYVLIDGTAAGAFVGFPLGTYPLAGKTGTAEIKPKQPYSWFAAMSLVPDKPYVVVAMVEEGGHGSTTAAPVVRRIFEGLFGIDTSGGLTGGGNAD
jgi:penicillin-binding protein 2